MATVRPWGRLSNSPLDFASADSAMGHTADLALGIALAQPNRTVICLNGDGSMLMTLGTLATIIDSRVRNLVLFVMNNGVYEITGGQLVPASAEVDYVSMAKATGFNQAFRCETEEECKPMINEALRADGPTFVSVLVNPGTEGPIFRRPNEEAFYLRTSLAQSARQFRQQLTNRPSAKRSALHVDAEC